jgi:CCR4-NOT transcription complex subunit 4
VSVSFCLFSRMVAEVNAEKKQKPQKVKTKTSADARKHLSSVRVIQRNLVYIIGLPNNLMDESVSYLLLTFSFLL